MASESEASCEADPNFAVICGFLEKFGPLCGLNNIDFLDLQEMLENTQEVSPELIDLHVKLLRKARKTVHAERWERAVIKFCHTFCSQDAWELERFGYKKARLASKVRILKELLETQFDHNQKFKTEINKITAEDLRSQPIGRDTAGRVYWYQCDESCQIRIYKDDPDDETWTLIAKDRDGLVSLISRLNNSDSTKSSSEPVSNEDSNSVEVEKPTLDTGQSQQSPQETPSEEKPSDKPEESQNVAEIPEDACDALDLSKDEPQENSKLLDLSVKVCPPIRLKPLAELIERKTGGKPLSFKRQRPDYNSDNQHSKKPHKEEEEEDEDSVGEEIEEPVMLVRGNGQGFSNKSGNCEVSPIVGEEIEEDVVYFHGFGNGADCNAGNTGKDETKKPEYKLGKIIDSKTDKIETRSPDKKSRWDVGGPKPEVIDSSPKAAAPASFFFGARSFGFTSPKSASLSFGASQSIVPGDGEIVDNKLIDENVASLSNQNKIVENKTEEIKVSHTHEGERKSVKVVNTKLDQDIERTQINEEIDEEKHKDKKDKKDENNSGQIEESHKVIPSTSDIIEGETIAEKIVDASTNKEATSRITKSDRVSERSSSTESVAKNVGQEITTSIKSHLDSLASKEKVCKGEHESGPVHQDIVCSGLDIESTIPKEKSQTSSDKNTQDSMLKIAAEVGAVIESDVTQKLKDDAESSLGNIVETSRKTIRDTRSISEDISKAIECEILQGNRMLKNRKASSGKLEEISKNLVCGQVQTVTEVQTDNISESKKSSKECQAEESDKFGSTSEGQKNKVPNEGTENQNNDKIPVVEEDNIRNVQDNLQEKECVKIPEVPESKSQVVNLQKEETENLEDASPKENFKLDVDSSSLTEKLSTDVILQNVETGNPSETIEGATSKDNFSSFSATENVGEKVIGRTQKEEKIGNMSDEKISETLKDNLQLVIDSSCASEKVMPQNKDTEKPPEILEQDNLKVDIDSASTTENVTHDVVPQNDQTKKPEVILEEANTTNLKDSSKLDIASLLTTANVSEEVISHSGRSEMLEAANSIQSLKDKNNLKLNTDRACTTENFSKKDVPKIEEPEKQRQFSEELNSISVNDKDSLKSDIESSTESVNHQNKEAEIIEEENSTNLMENDDSTTENISENKNKEQVEDSTNLKLGIPQIKEPEEQAKTLQDSNLTRCSNDNLKVDSDSCRTENVSQEMTSKNKETAGQIQILSENTSVEKPPNATVEENQKESPSKSETSLLSKSKSSCQPQTCDQMRKSDQLLDVQNEYVSDSKTDKGESNFETPNEKNSSCQNSEDDKDVPISEELPTKQLDSEMSVETKAQRRVTEKQKVDEMVEIPTEEIDTKSTDIEATESQSRKSEEPTQKSKRMKTAKSTLLEPTRKSKDNKVKPTEVLEKSKQEKDTESAAIQDPRKKGPTVDISSDTDYDNADIAEMCYSPLPDSEPEQRATTIEDVDTPDDPLCLSSDNSLDGAIKRFKIQKNPDAVSKEASVETVAKRGGKATRSSWRGRGRGRGRGGYRATQKLEETKAIENPVNGKCEIIEVQPEETGIRRSSRRRPVENVPIVPAKSKRGRGGRVGNLVEPERVVEVPENNTKQSRLSRISHGKDLGEDEGDAQKRIDCSEGVMVQGVLIKGDITLKIKDKPTGVTPKSRPFLSCVNIQKLKEPDTADSPVSVKSSNGEDEDGSDVVVIDDDPLAGSDSAETQPKKKPMTLGSFQLDHDDDPPQTTTRALRKRRNQSDNEDQKDQLQSKKRKLKGKRQADLKLRKSIEDQKKHEVISSSSEEEIETKKVVEESPKEKVTPRSRAKRKKTLLGLDIPESVALAQSTESNVRQSRRIAQIKIKEEAERRKIDEFTHQDVEEKKRKSKKNEDKDFKVEKTKKKSKHVEEAEDEEDEVIEVPSDDDNKKKKRKRKHKDPRKIFDESNPWRSSSDSSSNDEQADEDEEEIAEYSDAGSPLFRSDHEFSPESDIEEPGGEAQPLKRARTARKEDEEDVDDDDDHACQKCGKNDHPEWILLCDGCDNGWHCSCLRPALLVIPEGDWYCPPCQHGKLVKNLEEKLTEFDKKLAKREIEVRRKERLAYVGISLANVLPDRKKKPEEDEESESSESESNSESSTDDSDEPIYQLRQRRQAKTYRFNDYDDLINSAIQDEMDAVKGAGNQGRGKDIANIVNADAEEREVEALPPVVPKELDQVPPAVEPPSHGAESEEEEPVAKPSKKFIGRKKTRKLNSLDVSSGDDADSDEDFKGSSSEEDEDDFEEEAGSDSSDAYRGKRRGPIRRSTRARTSRYDKEFIDDDDSDYNDEAPKRKKNRPTWDESESEDSDKSWGRRKRSKRAPPVSSRGKKKVKRSKKHLDDSDDDRSKKKKRRIRYGGLNDDDDEGEETGGRRTRGKKINFAAVLASDSDDEEIRRKAPPRIESDDDYVADENPEQEDDEEEVAEPESKPESQPESKPENKPESKLESKPESKSEQTEERKEELPAESKEALKQVEDVVDNSEKADTSLEDLPDDDDDDDDDDDELNPIEAMNKNLEEMDEEEMEKMMEEEDYANKQLELMAMQLNKEKKRKEAIKRAETDDKKSHKQKQDPIPQIPEPENLSKIQETVVPSFSQIPPANVAGSPKKRRGRGKGKKTLEKEAAAAAATVTVPPTVAAAEAPGKTIIPSTVETLGAKLAVAAPPQPFSQTQPSPSVITRMLQGPPGPPDGYAATIPPYYSERAAPVETSGVLPVPSTGGPETMPPYMHGPRNMSQQYRQPPPPHLYHPRGSPAAPPSSRMRAPVYHHHTMDSSPTGGEVITTNPAEEAVPLVAVPTATENPHPSPVRHPTHMHPHRVPLPYQPQQPAYYGGYVPPTAEENLQGAGFQYAEFSENNSPPETSKGYEEETGGEFGGLVSYFSSQREDDLDT